MKVLICLSVVLALANGHVITSGVIGNGLIGGGLIGGGVIGAGGLVNSVYNTGGLISAPLSYVQSAPAVQTVHVVKQPVIQTIASPVVTSYRSAPIVTSSVVSSPVISHSYGLSYGPRYASYGLGGLSKVVSVGAWRK